MGAGRYAPSPTGDLHLGNLRTALIAWAAARSTNRAFYLRLEDLDAQRRRDPAGQIRDLKLLGIDWDGEIVVQSERLSRYEKAIQQLQDRDLTFECFCSRRDLREAASAPHMQVGHYPGTCLHLSPREAEEKREEFATRGLLPALRLRPRASEWTAQDMYRGSFTGAIDNVVLRRGDGTFAYNLAVVVDDVAMGVDQIVRGDDLLPSSPVHSYLTQELGGAEATYGHVPLVLGPTGKRLAKRDGAVTMTQLLESGKSSHDVVTLITSSLGAPKSGTAADFLEEFPRLEIPQKPWIYDIFT